MQSYTIHGCELKSINGLGASLVVIAKLGIKGAAPNAFIKMYVMCKSKSEILDEVQENKCLDKV